MATTLKFHSVCAQITEEGPRLAYDLKISGVSRETKMKSTRCLRAESELYHDSLSLHIF